MAKCTALFYTSCTRAVSFSSSVKPPFPFSAFEILREEDPPTADLSDNTSQESVMITSTEWK